MCVYIYSLYMYTQILYITVLKCFCMKHKKYINKNVFLFFQFNNVAAATTVL